MSNSEKGKFRWIRSFLFGKKNRDDSYKRIKGVKSNNIVHTNIHTDKEEQEKMHNLHGNVCSSDQKNLQKPGECPGKMFPLERRGCGFHVYFCIDNGEKPNFAKVNKTKKLLNEHNKVENSFRADNRPVSSINKTESLTKTRSRQSLCPHACPKSVISRGRVKSPVEINNTTAPQPPTVKKSKEVEIGKHIYSGPTPQDEVRSAKGSSSLPRIEKISHVNVTDHSHGEFLERSMSNREKEIKNSTEKKSPLERAMSNKEKENKNSTEKKSEPELPRSPARSGINQDEAPFEGSRASRFRRSSLRSRRSLVRNSLISLRKKRYSYVDTVVPEIISKLDHIEEKLAELEKIYDDKGKNVTNIVGISCNSPRSKLSIDLKTHEDEVYRKISANGNPSNPSSYSRQPIVIKCCGEEVLVNTPQSVSVVKKMKSKQDSNQLVYHNTQELDAHNITSKSFSKTKTIGSPIKKNTVGVHEQSITVARVQDINMWRRISEELKF